MIKLDELSLMSDRFVIRTYQEGTTYEKNLAVKVLLKRYNGQIDKQWYKLTNECGGVYYFNVYEDDFKIDAQETLLKALNAINLDKTYDDNWKFVTYFGFYLSNLRKTYRRVLINELSCVKSLDAYINTGEEDSPEYDLESEMTCWNNFGYEQSPEEKLLEKCAEEALNKVISECYNTWDDRQKTIYNYKVQGLANKEIASKLNLKMDNVYYSLKQMKKSIETRLKLIPA